MHKMLVLYVVHPEGVSTWMTRKEGEAYMPMFAPLPWQMVLEILPLHAYSIQVRLEKDATAWPKL
jgi:hypothetical protein